MLFSLHLGFATMDPANISINDDDCPKYVGSERNQWLKFGIMVLDAWNDRNQIAVRWILSCYKSADMKTRNWQCSGLWSTLSIRSCEVEYNGSLCLVYRYLIFALPNKNRSRDVVSARGRLIA